MNRTILLIMTLSIFVLHLLWYPIKGRWGGVSNATFTSWVLQGLLMAVVWFISSTIINDLIFAGERSLLSLTMLALAVALVVAGGLFYRRRRGQM